MDGWFNSRKGNSVVVRGKGQIYKDFKRGELHPAVDLSGCTIFLLWVDDLSAASTCQLAQAVPN